MSATTPPLKVLLCGACMSGNMGGPALYLGMQEAFECWMCRSPSRCCRSIPVTDCALRTSRLATHWILHQRATTDARGAFVAALWRTACARPHATPFAGRFHAGGPESRCAHRLSGISFTDDRAVSGLVINVLWLLPALATGLPFSSRRRRPLGRSGNRSAARSVLCFVLNRAAALAARGAESASHVRALLPQREVEQLDDLAFLCPRRHRRKWRSRCQPSVLIARAITACWRRAMRSMPWPTPSSVNAMSRSTPIWRAMRGMAMACRCCCCPMSAPMAGAASTTSRSVPVRARVWVMYRPCCARKSARRCSRAWSVAPSSRSARAFISWWRPWARACRALPSAGATNIAK